MDAASTAQPASTAQRQPSPSREPARGDSPRNTRSARGMACAFGAGPALLAEWQGAVAGRAGGVVAQRRQELRAAHARRAVVMNAPRFAPRLARITPVH